MIERFKKEQPVQQGKIYAEHRIKLNSTTDPHLHDYFEIEYIVSAEDTDIYIDEKKYEAKPGIIYFLSPINTHNLIIKNFHIIHIAFLENNCDNTLLSQLVSVSKNTIFHLSEEERVFVEALLNEMTENSDNNDYLTILLNTLLKKLLLLHFNSQEYDNSGLSATQKAILYIISNFKKNISLDDISAHVGLTPTYFSSVFKKEMGISFKEYLDDTRFNHARNLILYSASNMHEVCYSSGFSNYENFVRRFKDRFGYPPRDYRSKFKTK